MTIKNIPDMIMNFFLWNVSVEYCWIECPIQCCIHECNTEYDTQFNTGYSTDNTEPNQME